MKLKSKFINQLPKMWVIKEKNSKNKYTPE
jgi:hypothetical protein